MGFHGTAVNALLHGTCRGTAMACHMGALPRFFIALLLEYLGWTAIALFSSTPMDAHALALPWDCHGFQDLPMLDMALAWALMDHHGTSMGIRGSSWNCHGTAYSMVIAR